MMRPKEAIALKREKHDLIHPAFSNFSIILRDYFSNFSVSDQSRVGGGDSTPRNPMLYGADRAAGVVGPYKRRPRLNRYLFKI